MKRLYIPILYILIMCIHPGFGQDNSGFAFLKIDTDARAAAMAGSYVATTNDASATFYNPAGLNLAESQSFLIMYNDWLWDLSHSYAAIQLTQGDHNLALSFNFQQTLGIEVREQPTEEPSGTTDPFYFSAAVSYATSYNDDWDIGVSVKYLFEKSYLYSAPGFAIDFGIIKSEIFDFIDFGFSILNLGKMDQLKNQATPLPVIVVGGLSMKIPDLYGESFIIAPSLQYIKDEKVYLKLGMEYQVNNYMHLRAGIKNANEEMLWTTGFGLNFNNINVDYAYVPFEYNLEPSNIISLKFEY